MLKRVLVTGATGFIGGRLCAVLRQNGHEVIALARTARAGPWDTLTVWDAMDSVSVPENVDVIFHLAGKAHALSETGQDEDEYFHINTAGTRRLLKAAKATGVRRFVFFSSIKAISEGGDICLDEQAACEPETSYGKSKLEAERLVVEGGFVPEPVVLRLSMVYGPTYKGNLPRMIESISKGRFPPLPETGNKRSMVHVDDVVQAAILAAKRVEAVDQTYIVTDGTSYSTRQIYEWICHALEMPVPSWHVSMSVLQCMGKIGDGISRLRGRRFMFDSDALEKLVGSACYSSGKIEHALKFTPKHHLRDSLPEIVRYLGLG